MRIVRTITVVAISAASVVGIFGYSKASDKTEISIAQCSGYFIAIAAWHAQHNQLQESVNSARLSAAFSNALKKTNANKSETDAAFAKAKSISDSDLTKNMIEIIKTCVAVAQSPENKSIFAN